MNRLPTLVLILCCVCNTAKAQTNSTTEAASPKQVIEHYWKMEINGGRLTESGWRDASAFYALPSPRPQRQKIFVIYNDWAIWKPEIEGQKARVMIGLYIAGQLDTTTLRFIPVTDMGPKQIALYQLVYTDMHWEADSKNGALKQVRGRPDWKLEKPDPVLWLTIDSAIRYLKDVVEGRPKDGGIRTNASRSITTLEQLRSKGELK